MGKVYDNISLNRTKLSLQTAGNRTVPQGCYNNIYIDEGKSEVESEGWHHLVQLTLGMSKCSVRVSRY